MDHKNNQSFLLRNSFILSILKGAGLLLTFLTSIFISRFYGAETTGLYYLFLSILALLSLFTKYGLDRSLVKVIALHDYPKEKNVIRGIWLSAITASSILCIITIVVSLTLVELDFITAQMKSNISYLYYTLFCIIPFTIIFINASAMRGIRKNIPSSTVETILIPLTFIALLAFFYYLGIHRNIFEFYFAACLITFVISSFLLYRMLQNNEPAIKHNVKDLIRNSTLIFGINATNFIAEWGATFILSSYDSLESIGIFNICVRITSIFSILMLVLNNITDPIFSKLHHENKINEISKLAGQSAKLLNIVGLPLIAIIYIYSDVILSTFGDEFIQGAIILKILLIGQACNFLSGSAGYILIMTGHNRIMLSLTITVSILQVILFIAFIPTYGILAAAIITATTTVGQLNVEAAAQ